jgi:bifunctional non-homologous end joining protein LigD
VIGEVGGLLGDRITKIYGAPEYAAGERVLAFVTPGKVRLVNSNGSEITSRLPEIRPITRALGSVSAVLDGVLVGFDADGRPDPGKVEMRLALASDSAVRRRAKSDPLALHLFDAGYLDGRTLLHVPYEERRERLEALGLEAAAWLVPGNHRGDGELLLRHAQSVGIEAIIAKRLDSPYRPGRSEGDWIRATGKRTQP